MPSTPTIAWISIAPVKSLAMQALTDAEIGPHGIPGDRRFALLDAATRRVVNAKRVGRLIVVRPTVSADGGYLALDFPDGTRVEAAVECTAPGSGIFYGLERAVHHLAGPFDEAISAFAGLSLHLVEMAGPGTGVDRGDKGATVSLADTASLRELAALGGRHDPLDQRRFRMTIGIDGVAPYAEDAWLGKDVRVGTAVVRPGGNVGRCATTTRDPDTADIDFDTLGCLAQTRGELETTEPLPLGVWATVVTPGHVRLGDQVVPPIG
jgi:uncharacterized protein YcbX